MERETREKAFALKPRAEMTTEDVAAGVKSREDILEAAAASGDTLTLRAFDLAPPAFRLVSEEAISAAAALYAQKIDPEGYSVLEQQRSTLDMLKYNQNTAIRHFEEMAQTRLRPDATAASAGVSPIDTE
jgi:hypothetical protein